MFGALFLLVVDIFFAIPQLFATLMNCSVGFCIHDGQYKLAEVLLTMSKVSGHTQMWLPAPGPVFSKYQVCFSLFLHQLICQGNLLFHA